MGKISDPLLKFFIIAAGLLFGGVMATPWIVGGVRYKYEITGSVINVSGRIVSSSNSDNHVITYEKFSVRLTNVGGDLPTAWRGQKQLAVNCNSTDCSSLLPGNRVQLDCRVSFRWLAPNVLECKYAKTLDPADDGDGLNLPD